MKHKKFNPSKPILISSPIATGPITEAGKHISSRNATKHGCCSTETLILATESTEEFKSLENTWFRAYEPTAEIEVHLVRQLVHADWFLQRATRHCAQVEAGILAITPNLTDWTEDQHRSLNRFLRYRTTHTNTVAKRTKALEDYRKNRAADLTRAQTARHKEEKLAIAKVKLEIYKEKSKEKKQPDEDGSEKTWHEHLEAMRSQAIALGFTPKPRP